MSEEELFAAPNAQVSAMARISTCLAQQIEEAAGMVAPGDGIIGRFERHTATMTLMTMVLAKVLLALGADNAEERVDRIATTAKLAIKGGHAGWDGT